MPVAIMHKGTCSLPLSTAVAVVAADVPVASGLAITSGNKKMNAVV